MKWTSWLAIAGVAASLATLPTAAHAQRGARLGPAERVLAQRAELNLTDDQVARLESIRDSYAEKEKPWVDELRTHMPQAGERGRRGARRQRPDLPPAAKAAMDSLRTSRESARKEVSAVLTEAQREQVKQMVEQRRERRPREMRRQGDSARVRGA